MSSGPLASGRGPEYGHQTVVIRRGRHDSPQRGACVIELASMLAGEPFSDRPASVCPVIAGFLRGYNDLLPEGQHDELYAYAARVVGTAAPAAVRRRRARRIIGWADGGRRTHARGMFVHVRPWDLILLPAVEAALRMAPERRRVEVSKLLDELVAMGAPTGAAPEPPSAPSHDDSLATAAPEPAASRPPAAR